MADRCRNRSRPASDASGAPGAFLIVALRPARAVPLSGAPRLSAQPRLDLSLSLHDPVRAAMSMPPGGWCPACPLSAARWLLPVILVFGVLFRLAVLPAPPSLSTDMYRYVWDGRLTMHGINPYRWTPNAQTLRSLRDPIWEKMEYKPYQTIYMPVSQAFFALANALFGNNLIGYKALYTLFDCGVMVLGLLLLQSLRALADADHLVRLVSAADHGDRAGGASGRGRRLLPAADVCAGRCGPRRSPGRPWPWWPSVLTKGFALLLLPLFCRTYGWRFALVAGLRAALSGDAAVGLPAGIPAWHEAVSGQCPCQRRPVPLASIWSCCRSRATTMPSRRSCPTPAILAAALWAARRPGRLAYRSPAPLIYRAGGDAAGRADAVSLVSALAAAAGGRGRAASVLGVYPADGPGRAAVHVLYLDAGLLVDAAGRIRAVLCGAGVGVPPVASDARPAAGRMLAAASLGSVRARDQDTPSVRLKIGSAMRVMTYNIRGGLGMDGGGTRADRRSRARREPDIVCFQEVHRRLPWSGYTTSRGACRALGDAVRFQANVRYSASAAMAWGWRRVIRSARDRRLLPSGASGAALAKWSWRHRRAADGLLYALGAEAEERERQAAALAEWLSGGTGPSSSAAT